MLAGTVFQSTKLPLTTWFLAIYPLAQAKNGVSALQLGRHLGVNNNTAWLLKHTLPQAMRDRDRGRKLRGTVQIDDAYIGGERRGGKRGRGSENKTPLVNAVQVTEDTQQSVVLRPGQRRDTRADVGERPAGEREAVRGRLLPLDPAEVSGALPGGIPIPLQALLRSGAPGGEAAVSAAGRPAVLRPARPAAPKRGQAGGP